MSRKHNSPGIYFREIAMQNPYTESTKKIVENNTSTNSNVAHMLNAAYRVKIEPYKVDLTQPDSVNLKAYFNTELYGEVIKQQDITDSCEWYVNSVDATVENGVVTINKTGVNAEVAAVYNGFKGNAFVNVRSIISNILELNTTSINLEQGETFQVIATYYQIKDGVRDNGINVTEDCTWESSNPTAISVDKGKITSIKSGIDGTITVKYKGKEVTINVSVVSSYEYELEISETNINLNRGEEKDIIATYFVTKDGVRDNGTNVTEDCTWESSNPTAISVDKGKIKAIKSGQSAVITASYKEFSLTLNVTVESIIERYFEISTNDSLVDIEVGDNINIVANYIEIKDGIRTETVVSNECQWNIDKTIATIYENGRLEVISTGKSGEISATYMGITSNILTYNTKSVITKELTITFAEGYDAMFELEGETKLIATLTVTIDGIKTLEDVSDKCRWTSTNDFININKGVITSTKSGVSSRITAEYDEITSNTVTVGVDTIITHRLELILSETILDMENSYPIIVMYYTTTDGEEDNGMKIISEDCEFTYDETYLRIGNNEITAIKSGYEGTISAKYMGINSNEVQIKINSIVNYSFWIHYPNNIEELTLGTEYDYSVNVIHFEIDTDGIVDDRILDPSKCVFTTSNSENIEIKNGYILVPKTPGTRADITVSYTYNGETYSLNKTFYVADLIEHELEITPENAIIKLDNPLDFTVKYYTKTNYVKDDGIDVTFLEDCIITTNSAFFQIENKNTVKAIDYNQTATITATYLGLTDSTSIKSEKEYIVATYMPTESNNRIISDINIVESMLIDDSMLNTPITSLKDYVDGEEHIVKFTLKDTYIDSFKTDLFSGTTLTAIYIPNSITTLGNRVFKNCTKLTRITIPNSVISIGNEVFSGCIELQSVTLPENDTIKAVSEKMFYGCSKLSTIKIPHTYTTIGASAFENCLRLEEITTPLNLVSIGTSGFTNCNQLKTINLHKVSSIGNSAFEKCGTLNNIIIPNELTYISPMVFKECRSLTNITLSETLTSIGYEAFKNCLNLTQIALPSTLKQIWYEAFYECDSLEEIRIPNSVTSIGHSAFESCNKLMKVELPNNLKTIEHSTFSFCVALNDIDVPNTVTDINYDAFRYCSALTTTEYIIKEGLKTIGDNAFRSCYNLKRIYIPSSVTAIGKTVFTECNGYIVSNSHVLEIIVDSGNTVYDSRDNSNCIIETASDTLLYGCINTVIPDNIKHIYSYAFYQIPLLKLINLPDNILTIGEYAFGSCGLTSIKIPEQVNSIHYKSFINCTNLTEIIVDSGNTVYDSRDNSNCIIHTSTNKLICGCKTTIIPNTVTIIGQQAFYAVEFTVINIPESVTTLESMAFFLCRNLTNVTIPSSVKTIGDYTFRECIGLTEIIVDSGNTVYDSRDNSNCIIETASDTLLYGANINSKIPNNVKIIGEYAFAYNKGLTEINIPDSVTKINDNAFYDADNVTTIIINKNVNSIGRLAFSSLDNLQNVYVYCTTPPSLKTSFTNTFSGEKEEINIYYPKGSNYSSWSKEALSTYKFIEMSE